MGAPIADPTARRGHEGEHADAVRSMFDHIAPTYDLLNRGMSAGFDQRWRKAALIALDPNTLPEGRVLDLCAGTMDFSAALEQSTSRPVVALDFSAEMLRRGRSKVQRTEVLVGDATCLPFEDKSVAGIVCGFGLRNLGEPRLALSECKRVLMPGGKLVVLEFFRPDQGAFGALTKGFHAVYANAILPLAGKIVANDRKAYHYLAESMKRFLTRRETEILMGEAGFWAVSGEDLTFGIASLLVGVAP